MIRVRVADAMALAARTPAELSMYLRATGWRPEGRDGARVGDAVATLAVAEDRSELDVLHGITAVSTDVHSVRILLPDEPPGMLTLEDGATAYESVRNLVTASAYPVFANQHRVVQPARKPQGLSDFLRTVRIGRATEGSYTLTVHTPIPPRLAQQPALFETDAEPEDLPVQRQVSLRMYEAVRAACQAAEDALLTSDGLDPCTRAVADGLSANLCEALVGLGGSAGHPFELSLSLAAVRGEALPLRPVRFQRHHLPVLKEAAAELRARSPEEGVVVAGEVVRLHREPGEAGEITLVGRVDDQEPLRRIWMDLASDDYELAMRAHREMHEVTVNGNLVRRGTRYVLTQPSGFRIAST
jgi:hypothetical protein